MKAAAFAAIRFEWARGAVEAQTPVTQDWHDHFVKLMKKRSVLPDDKWRSLAFLKQPVSGAQVVVIFREQQHNNNISLKTSRQF